MEIKHLVEQRSEQQKKPSSLKTTNQDRDNTFIIGVFSHPCTKNSLTYLSFFLTAILKKHCEYMQVNFSLTWMLPGHQLSILSYKKKSGKSN